MKLVLRPHQEAIINQLRRNWKTHRTHLVYGCVGLGKTAIAAAITNGFYQRGLRVLFVAPYTTLVEQTAKRFMEYGLPQPSIIWQQHPWHDPYNLIQIASADTLIRRDMPDVDLLICDESHIRRAKLLNIIENCGIPVIGLTGTPFTKWLGRYYTNFVKVTTMREMIDIGYLSEYEIYAPTNPNIDLKGVRTSNLAAYGVDYNEDQIAEIMNGAQIVGDIVGNWIENGENEPTICFCVNVSHANHVTNEFNARGVLAEVMTAETPTEERLLIVKRFEDGITKVVCNVGVLVAGFDSDVRCIIYARPTKSEIRWIQCLGRGLRTATGKSRCKIFDHSGTVHRLGFPCSIEYDELLSDDDGMNSAKAARREKEKKAKEPKECKKCRYMKPAGVYVCPKCGFKPIGGENVEVDESRKLTQLNGAQKQASMADKQLWYSMLTHYAISKGYKSGWAYHKYIERFGIKPSSQLKQVGKQPSPEFMAWIRHLNIKRAKSSVRK